MKTVLIFGTFDVLHPGHIWCLRQAARYGRLTVALTPDIACRNYKKRLPFNNFFRRRQKLQMIRYVARVIPTDNEVGRWQIIERVRPDIIVIGYDQKPLRDCLQKRLRQIKLKPHLISLSAYRGQLYKSSKLINYEHLLAGTVV